MPIVAASEVQKNFGEWHDKAYEGPVEITRYGRTTAYLVSASLFRAMMASYRRAVPKSALDASDIALVAKASVETHEPYTLDDLPEVEPKNRPGR